MSMNTEKTEAVCNANTALSAAGLPTYTELVGLIREVANLGLNFDVGNAYIRRIYIDQQTALQSQIKALHASLEGTATVAHADHLQSI
jgi:N-formylglutamate amidohydrolase